MSASPSRSLLRAVGGLVLVLALSAVAVFAVMVQRDIDDATRPSDSIVWTAGQLQSEYLRFESRVLASALAGSGATPVDVRVPFEILVGRLDIIQTTLTWARGGDGLAAQFSSLRDAILGLEPLVDAFEAGDAGALPPLLTKLEAQQQPVFAFASQLANSDSLRSEALRGGIARLHVALGALIAGLAATLVLFALVQRRHGSSQAQAERRIAASDAARHESEQRFRVVADNIAAYLWMIDADSRVVFVNRAWGAAAPASTAAWLARIHPEDRDAIAASFAQSVASRQPASFEYRFHFDHGERWLLDEVWPRFDDEGRYLGSVGAAIDITERKTALIQRATLSALREREAFLAGILDTFPGAILVTDSAGRVAYVNGVEASFWGFTPEYAVGRPIDEFMSPALARRTHDLARQVVATRRSLEPILVREKERNGTTSAWMACAGPIFGSDGAVERIAFIATDITEQFRTEARLGAFLEHAPFGVSVKSPDGRYLMANAVITEGLGLKPEAIVGKSVRDVFDAATAEHVQRHDATVLARGRPWAEVREWPARGAFEPRTTLSIKFPIGGDVGEPSIGTIDVDISEQRRVERALRDNQAIMARAQSLAGLGTWTWTPTPNDISWSTTTVTYSDAAAAMFGAAPEDLVLDDDVYVERFVHPDDRERVAKACRDFERRRRSKEPLEYRIVRPDGAVRWIVEITEYLPAMPGEPEPVLGTIQDITALKSAEASAKASEALIRGMIDALPLELHVKDRDGCYIFVNEPQARRLGVTKEDFIGRTARDIAPDPDYDAWLESVEAKVWDSGQGTGFYREDYNLPGEDPGVWLTAKTPILDANGRPSHLVTFSLEVTEREELIAERDRTTAVVKAVGDAGLRFLAASDWNAAVPPMLADLGPALGVGRVLYLRAREQDGRRLFDVGHAWSAPGIAPIDDEPGLSDITPCIAPWLGDLDAGRTVGGAVEALGAQSCLVVPVATNGRLRGVLAVLETVADRLWSPAETAALQVGGTMIGEAIGRADALQTLGEQESLLHAVMNAVPATMYVKDHAGRYLDVSEHFAQTFGRRREDLIGCSTFDLPLSFEFAKDNARLDAEIWSSRRPSGFFEVTVPRHDAAPVTLLASKTPVFGADGAPRYLVGAGIDITDRKRAEQTVRGNVDVLAAVSATATRFLDDADWRESIAQTMPDIGRAMGVSRAYLFQVHDGGGRRTSELVAEWTMPDVEPTADAAARTGIDVTEFVDFPRWVEAFEGGRPIAGNIAGFPADEQRYLASQDVRSILTVPVTVDGRHWGTLGVDQCDRERDWDAGETSALATAAAAVAAAVSRDRTLAALRRRDKVLEAVSGAAVRFLATDWRTCIDDVMAELGTATGASRVSIFRYDDGPPLLAHQTAEWVAPGVSSQRDNPALHDQGVEAIGLGRWAEVLARGEAISSRVRDLPASERPIFEDQRILSVSAVPVLVGQRLWGDLSIDICDDDRTIDPAEIEALRTAAGLLAAAVEREGVARELDAARARLQAFLENAPFSITIKDPAGRYLAANSHWLRDVDLTIDAALGRTVRELFPEVPDIITDVEDHEREVLASRKPVSRNRSGTVMPGSQELSIKFPILDAAGVIAAIGTLAIDMTERRRLEASLLESQKMEAIGQLTGGIAHDFNNLLTAVLGNLEMAADELGPASPLRAYLDVARRAGEHGAELTKRLLAFSRRQDLALKAVDINRLLNGMTDLLRRPLGPTIDVALDLDGQAWTARSDPVQLETAILNLAINARDAMPVGGRLVLTSGNVTLRRDDPVRHHDVEPGDFVVIGVHDTGTGIPPEVLAHVFEPFFTTKEIGKGTGLGLSMVLGFARQSGGFARIESAVGQGTTVRLYLPRAQAPVAVEPVVGRAVPNAAGSETVLVVDDDPAVLQLAVAMLKSLGYTVMDCADGARALDILRTGTPVDLLLCDVIMPGTLNGRAVAAEAGALRPDLPILFMSGYTDSTFADDPDFDPATQLVSKPFTRATLAERVRQRLGAGVVGAAGIEPATPAV